MNSVVGLFKWDINYNLDVEIQGIPGSVYTTAVSQEESKILFGTQDGKVYVYKVQTEEANLIN